MNKEESLAAAALVIERAAKFSGARRLDACSELTLLLKVASWVLDVEMRSFITSAWGPWEEALGKAEALYKVYASTSGVPLDLDITEVTSTWLDVASFYQKKD